MKLDFQRQPTNSTEFINTWVSENTNGKIKDLIPPGVINRMTALVLANALALKVVLKNKSFSLKLN